MADPTIYLFFDGLVAMGWLVAAGFFARFFVRTREPFFAALGTACALLAVSPALHAFLQPSDEHASWIYLFRLAAFLVIIAGVIQINLRPHR